MNPQNKVKVMVIFPKPKRTHNVFNLSGIVKIFDLLKGGTPLAEVGQH
jgi:hypothetical protein